MTDRLKKVAKVIGVGFVGLFIAVATVNKPADTVDTVKGFAGGLGAAAVGLWHWAERLIG